MLLNSIKLKNFISCENVEINIPQGLTGIFGSNGSGKSTIFRDGIYYALYGQTLRVKSAKDYIKNKQKEFEIQLDFSLMEDNYSVNRFFNKRNFKEVNFFINGEKENSLKTDIQKYINEVIGLDSYLYTCTTLITPESKSILEMSNPDRKAFFYKLLQLHEFNKFYELANKKNNELEKRQNILEYSLVQDQKKILEYETELRRILNDKEEIENILNNEQEIIKLREAKTLIAYLQKDYNKYENELNIIKNNLSNYYTLEEIEAIKDIKGNKDIIHNDISTLNGQIKNYETTHTKFKKLLLSTEKLENHECPTCEQNLDIDSIRSMLVKLEGYIKELSENLEHLKRKEHKINLCEKLLDAKKKFNESKDKLEKVNSNNSDNSKYDINAVVQAKNSKNKIKDLDKQIQDLKKHKDKNNVEFSDNKIIQTQLEHIIDFAINTPEQIIEQVFKSLIIKANELLNLIPNSNLLDPEDIQNSCLIYAKASTGEKFKMNLILRIALNIILSDLLKKKPIELLICDEGGIGTLDDNIALEITNILSTLISSGILKQIILITHKLELLDYCDNTFNVDKINESTKVIRIT